MSSISATQEKDLQVVVGLAEEAAVPVLSSLSRLPATVLRLDPREAMKHVEERGADALILEWSDGSFSGLRKLRTATTLVHVGRGVPQGFLRMAETGLTTLTAAPGEVGPLLMRHLATGRSSPRVALHAEARWEGADEGASTQNIGQGGCRILVRAESPASRGLHAHAVLRRFSVVRDGQTLLEVPWVTLRYVNAVHEGYLLGVRFPPVSLGEGDAPARRLSNLGERLAPVLGALQRQRLVLRTETGQTYSGLGGEITDDGLIVSPPLPLAEGQVVQGSFSLDGLAHHFSSVVAWREAKGTVLKVPEALVVRRARQRDRVPCSGITIRFTLPFQDTQVVEPLVDLSVRGCAVEVPAEAMPLPAGARLQEAALEAPGLHLPVSPTVRAVRASGEGHLVGLSFDGLTPLAQGKLAQLFLKQAEPAFGQKQPSPEELWSLWRESGLLSAEVAQRLEQVPGAAFETHRKLGDAPPTLSHTLTLTGPDGQLSAVVQLQRFFSATWSIQHLAVSPRLPKRARVDQAVALMQTSSLMAQQVPACRFIEYFMYGANAPMRHALGKLTDSRRDRREYRNQLQAAFLVDPTSTMAVPPTPGFEARAMESTERAWVQHTVARATNLYLAEALDLTEATMDLGQVKALWAQAGLERDRRVLVVQRGSERVAVGVLELASVGACVQQRLCCLSVFTTDRRFEVREAALLRLTEEAHRYFRRKGQPFYRIFTSVADAPVLTALGLGVPPQVFQVMNTPEDTTPISERLSQMLETEANHRG